MLYMVEMNLEDHRLLAEWTQWYEGHLRLLLSIPGFLSAQRFKAEGETASPFLAVYTLAHADVIDSEAYRAKAGPGSTGVWRNRMNNWHRNILSGLPHAPQVNPGGWLAVMDRRSDAAPALPADYARLTPVGLDRTLIERGLAVGAPGTPPPAPGEAETWSLRVFSPLTAKLTPQAASAVHGV